MSRQLNGGPDSIVQIMSSAAKEDARKGFRALHQNFMAALAGAACLNQPDHLDSLTKGKGHAAIIGPGGKGTAFPLHNIKRALEEDKVAVLRGFIKMNFRIVMLESYECLAQYYKRTNQYTHPLKDQPWFHFFRLIRNCMAQAEIGVRPCLLYKDLLYCNHDTATSNRV